MAAENSKTQDCNILVMNEVSMSIDIPLPELWGRTWDSVEDAIQRVKDVVMSSVLMEDDEK